MEVHRACVVSGRVGPGQIGLVPGYGQEACLAIYSWGMGRVGGKQGGERPAAPFRNKSIPEPLSIGVV
jgi:hypothetical protein